MTPVLAPTATPESSRDAAAVLIQRLLRGRAAQNAMYEGRMRRQALIEELKLEATDAGERRLQDWELGMGWHMAFYRTNSALPSPPAISTSIQASSAH